MRRTRRFSLNAIEAAMFAVGLAFLAYMAGRHFTEIRLQPFLSTAGMEMQVLQARYGPSRHSEGGEEWIVRDFFKDERDGVFVDVGANHYEKASNTYYLETALGWSGVAIDPQAKFAADYRKHRPRTRFLALFISDASDGDAILHVPKNDRVASSSQDFAHLVGGTTDSVKVPTSTLDDVLRRSGIAHFDFLNLDVELAEPAALAGFSIATFRPRLVSIEAHPQVRQQILDYFARHGYVAVGRYLRADGANLWFTPLEPTPALNVSAGLPR